jgi:hypothetical protein
VALGSVARKRHCTKILFRRVCGDGASFYGDDACGGASCVSCGSKFCPLAQSEPAACAASPSSSPCPSFSVFAFPSPRRLSASKIRWKILSRTKYQINWKRDFF